MSVIIRPAAFSRGASPRFPVVVQNEHSRWFAEHFLFAGHFLSVVLGIAVLAWIITLAGAAFAIRTVLVLCFAALAGRAAE